MPTRLIFTFIFFGSVISISAQTQKWEAMANNHKINFYDVVKEAETYFNTIDKTAKGSGWKGYQRWKNQNEYKYYPNGNRANVRPDFVHREQVTLQRQFPPKRNLFQNGWKDLGPYTIDSITGHYAAGLGRIEDFYVNPQNANTIYLSSRSGGFWKSSNAGVSWSGSTTDFLPGSGVNVMSVSPTNPDSILINVRNAQNGNSYGIYRSSDGGITFNESNFNPTNIGQGGLGDNFQIYSIAYHPTIANLIFIGTNEGLYRSDDNLLTWTNSNNLLDISKLEFHPTNPDILYFYDSYYWSSNHDVIYISTDRGLSFVASSNISGNNDRRSLRISTSPDCPNCVYVAWSSGVYLSIDEGKNFAFLTNPDESCQGFAVSDVDTSSILYGYVDLEMSTDGGRNFSQTTYWSLGNTNGAGNGHQNSYETSTNYVHADLRVAKCINGVFYVGTDGLFCRSIDNGITWENIGEGIGIRENYRLGLSQSNYGVSVSGSQDNGTSIKNEEGWIEFYGADGMEAIITPLNDDWMISSLQNGGRRRTYDGGLTQNGATPSGSNSGDWIAPLAYDPNDQFSVYDFRDLVYHSNEFGSNYTSRGSPSFTGNIQHAEIAQNNSNILFVARGNQIEKSIDGGLTFVDTKNNLPNHNIQDIAIDPNNDDIVIVVYARYQNDNEKVFLSVDGGSTWTNITYNLGNMPIRSVVIDHTQGKNIYLGAEVGVYTMELGNNTWTPFSTNLPNVAIRELEINYGANLIKAATWGRGLWEYHLKGKENYPSITHTSISDPPTFDTPKESIGQFVSSKIHYDGYLQSVFVKWSDNGVKFDNTISMANIVDTTWRTIEPLPTFPENAITYFKVYAVGENMDTSVTYKFMFTTRAFEYCEGLGSSNNGNLFINNVSLENLNHSSSNETYSSISNPIVQLQKDSTYTIDISGNTGWSENDYAAWIDYNNNTEFEEQEQVLLSVGSGNSAVGQFTVPSNAIDTVDLKMRVRLSYWGSDPQPCGTTLGEVEDFKVRIAETCKIVSNTLDSGSGSLRAAIQCANSGDTIRFNPILNAHVITINSSPLIIDKDLVIFNDLPNGLSVSSIQPRQASLVSVFQIDAGHSTEFHNFSVLGAFGLEGSGIINSGNLKLVNMDIHDGRKLDILSTVKNIGTGQIEILGTSFMK